MSLTAKSSLYLDDGLSEGLVAPSRVSRRAFPQGLTQSTDGESIMNSASARFAGRAEKLMQLFLSIAIIVLTPSLIGVIWLVWRADALAPVRKRSRADQSRLTSPRQKK